MKRAWNMCAATAAVLALSGSVMIAAAPGRRAASDHGRPSNYIGCLRGEYGSFQLTEVGGPDVPETRNWRTLYLTKMRAGRDGIRSNRPAAACGDDGSDHRRARGQHAPCAVGHVRRGDV